MNVSTGPSPELPAPISSPEQGAHSPEAPKIAEKQSVIDSAPLGPTTSMPAVDPSQFATVPQTSQVVTTDDNANDEDAEDSDVIEKEWVTKAKAIVNSTRNNPSEQSKELGKFKAEYIKKRFNKEVKMPKEPSVSS